MEQVTNPLMRFTSRFYEDDVRRGVEEIRRRRAAQAEAERAAEDDTDHIVENFPQLKGKDDRADDPAERD